MEESRAEESRIEGTEQSRARRSRAEQSRGEREGRSGVERSRACVVFVVAFVYHFAHSTFSLKHYSAFVKNVPIGAFRSALPLQVRGGELERGRVGSQPKWVPKATPLKS